MAILDGINIDNTPKEDGRTSISKRVSDINEARKILDTQNSALRDKATEFQRDNATIKENVRAFNEALDALTENIKKKTDSKNQADKEEAKAIQSLLASLGLTEKKLQQLPQTYKEVEASFKKIIQDNNTTGEKFLDTVQALEDIKETIGDTTVIFKILDDAGYKLNKQLKNSIENEAAIIKARKQEAREGRERDKAEYIKAQKTANESKFSAVISEASNLADNLKGLVDTLNINKIAQQLAPSTKQQIQAELQTNFNLSSNEFEQFKRDLYSQINTSLYTVEEVNNAMQTLNTTALDGKDEAIRYFPEILRGQKALGMSSETQQQLLKLSNITGKNELMFYQGTVAKFLNSSLGLNKKQLDELVAMNATLTMQAADLGIATDEFKQMNIAETGAMDSVAPGYGSKFAQMESTLLANTDTTAALLGMDSGQLSERLARGESLIDIIRNSSAGASAALGVLANGTAAEQTRMFEHAKDAWGVDSNTWSVLRVIAQQSGDLNKSLITATEAQTQDTLEALEKISDREGESLTFFQKALNSVTNWFNGNIPWAFEATLTSISVGVFAILSTLKSIGNISQILQALNGGGTSGVSSDSLKWFGGTGAGGKLFGAGSKLGGTAGMSKFSFGNGAAASAAKVAGPLAVLAGVGWASIDAYKGYNDTSKELYGKNVTTGEKWKTAGITAASGSTVHKTASGNVDIMKNVNEGGISGGNKGALIGMGIGMLGGPVGMAAGAVIGGIIGAIAGASAGGKKAELAIKEQQKATEEMNENIKKITETTETISYNTKKDSVGIVYRYRGTDNYSSSVNSGAITGRNTISRTNMHSSNAIGGLEDVGHAVTSGYREKRTYQDSATGEWHTDVHNGIDFVADEGTKLFSNVTGRVSMNTTERSGANIVAVTDDATGLTHLYAHLQSRSPLAVGTHVSKGDFIGYSGHTGVGTGPHLHYSVLNPGSDAIANYWKLDYMRDPGPYASASIFNGDASTIISDANKSSSQAYTTTADTIDNYRRNSRLVNLEAIGGISGPIVNSIIDLKQTIIDLSAKTDRNEKILSMLTNKNSESPLV